MKNPFRFIAAAALGLFVAGAVFAANAPAIPYVTSLSTTDAVQIIKSGVPSVPNVYASGLQLRNFILAGNSQVGVTAPTLTSCGTGSPAVTGTNSAGVVTMGTSATGCIITFGTAYVSAPVCNVTSRTAYGTTALAYTVSASAITTTQSSTSSNLVDYICIAQPGG